MAPLMVIQKIKASSKSITGMPVAFEGEKLIDFPISSVIARIFQTNALVVDDLTALDHTIHNPIAKGFRCIACRRKLFPRGF